MAVVVETTVGDFTIDLFIKDRPRTCLNFLKLCKQHYYNFNLLFSIERNFVAQTGDPTGSGRGGDSIFKSMFGEQARLYEGEKLPVLRHISLGTVSMATYGSHTFGSQFFITLGDELDSLDEEHLVFGQVSEGLDVIAKLNDVLTDEKNRPYQDIRICHTVVLDDPFPDPDNIVFPDESPRPTPEVLASDYIAVDESVEDTAGKDISEIHEEIAAKEAEARATILEMVGDLPDADTAPPENVLFVCKLNPVTTSEDLEIIFSRFGKINCAEVIKDRITNNSLQYAFIEFDDKKSCEDAYFKMDNVLIDDRRIHVDFSQSVSKIQWKGKGRGVVLYDDKGKRVPDKKDNYQFKSKTRDEANKKDDAPKSRFIDTEAYSKRYKERHEAQNDRGMSHRNGERRLDTRPRALEGDKRQDRDHRDRRQQGNSREAAHFHRDHRDGLRDTYSNRDKDHRDTRRTDYDRNRRDQREQYSPFDEHHQGNKRQEYNRDQSRSVFPKENTDFRDGRDQNQRVRGGSAEKAPPEHRSDKEDHPDDEDGARDGHQRHKMMAMLRSELGGGKVRKATSYDTSDDDLSSKASEVEIRKKSKKKKKKKKRAALDSSESEDERKKKKKKRESSSDSEDAKQRKNKRSKNKDGDANHKHNKKKKSKKCADSSSDEHTRKKKVKKSVK